ncbi:MAG: type II toxin-antitoxin system VapC family toxin [Myxococcota bacterium]|nr:type II toxin-antitoxin system VapC family toxin [Myxococcota bacterium]
MRFWDSSAVVPLVVEERSSRACRDLVRADAVQVTWCFTRTEVVSALWRRHRDGALDASAVARAQARLDLLADRWVEVDALLLVRDLAERLLRVHPLRPAG